MLEAKKSKLFEKIFYVYNHNLLKRRFHSLNIRGSENFSTKDPNFPLLIYANHSSWWDGLVIFEILQMFAFENYFMMEEKQLKNLPLFRKLGAFSVIRENPRESLKSINYAVKKLKENPKTAVVIFPQGEILPNDLRPIKFFNGVSKIIEKSEKCYYVSIAVRYEFLNYFKPEIFVNIGSVKKIENNGNYEYKKLTNELELELTRDLDKLKERFVSNKLNDFENLL